MKQVTFDNTSITSSIYKINRLQDENSNNIQTNIFNLARQRGEFLLNKEFKTKTIEINGTILGNDSNGLETNIDSLKELLMRQGKNLDIEYSNGTRRYVSTCTSFEVDRDFYHLSYAPYKATFIVPSGVGFNISKTTSSVTDISSLNYVSNITLGGTTQPKMKILLKITADSSVTGFEMLVNGDKITISETIITDDVIIIDEENIKVTINGIEKDYIGIFPQWVVGFNVYQITFTATSLTYNLDFEYTKTYI